MVMRSIQLPMPARDSRKTDTPKTTAPTMRIEVQRGRRAFFSRAAEQASSMFIKEVMPAKNTDTKKRMAKIRPPGIC